MLDLIRVLLNSASQHANRSALNLSIEAMASRAVAPMVGDKEVLRIQLFVAFVEDSMREAPGVQAEPINVRVQRMTQLM